MAEQVKIKPLEWLHNKATTPFGDYTVFDLTERGLGYGFRRPDASEEIFCKSEKSAKAAVEADFQTRIRSALLSGGPEK